jgi:hypothetical protein
MTIRPEFISMEPVESEREAMIQARIWLHVASPHTTVCLGKHTDRRYCIGLAFHANAPVGGLHGWSFKPITLDEVMSCLRKSGLR